MQDMILSKLNAISLFSGAGGMDVGVSQAGFDVRACVELDKHCCETLRENFRRQGKDTLVFEGDIQSFDPAHILASAGIAAGKLDLLFGGPPCQAFSQIGKQKSLDDLRGQLLFQIVRYAEALQPKALMIEQVKGLLSAKDKSGKSGGVFEEFVRQLEALGYSPKWRVLTAANYGVAQLRQRVFIVATKAGEEFSFPVATHDESTEDGSLFSLLPYRTAGEVLAGLEMPPEKNSCAPVPDNSHYDVTPKGDIRRIHGVPEGGHLASQLHLPQEQRGNLTRKDTTKFLRLDRNKPANTLRGGEIFFHPTEERYLTPREYMRLHGYPDEYVLRGPIRGRSGSVKSLDQHRQIGNSVPPPLAKAVAAEIRRMIECPKSTSCMATR